MFTFCPGVGVWACAAGDGTKAVSAQTTHEPTEVARMGTPLPDGNARAPRWGAPTSATAYGRFGSRDARSGRSPHPLERGLLTFHEPIAPPQGAGDGEQRNRADRQGQSASPSPL